MPRAEPETRDQSPTTTTPGSLLSSVTSLHRPPIVVGATPLIIGMTTAEPNFEGKRDDEPSSCPFLSTMTEDEAAGVRELAEQVKEDVEVRGLYRVRDATGRDSVSGSRHPVKLPTNARCSLLAARSPRRRPPTQSHAIYPSSHPPSSPTHRTPCSVRPARTSGTSGPGLITCTRPRGCCVIRSRGVLRTSRI